MKRKNVGGAGKLFGLFAAAVIGQQMFPEEAWAIPTPSCCQDSSACSGCYALGGGTLGYVKLGTNPLRQCTTIGAPAGASCYQSFYTTCYDQQQVPLYADNQCTIDTTGLVDVT